MVRGQVHAAGLTITQEVGTQLPLLRADHRRIRQILFNLLSNAIKFTPPKGSVVVSALSEGAELAISVADNGIGMAPEHIQRAFERFGQVDNSLSRKYEGAGLGLSIAKQLAELHGGRLDLQSKLDLGTTVTLVFPADRLIARKASSKVLEQVS